MWRITDLNIKNIVSFHEASLSIEQNVATLIFGKNEDNASQPCNGSGKSSLVEAISFALTGEQLRKVRSVEEIIHDDADNAMVHLRLENDYDHTSMTIERHISRTALQVIKCHKYDADGKEIDKDKTIQPTVLDYNKMILEEIGLSKDDIYNNFILCDNKYESFFECSDKSKKEIVNRFSNGEIVDESIAKLQRDMAPINDSLNSATGMVSKITGSIQAIEVQIGNVNLQKQERAARRIEAIERINKDIQDTEANISRIKEHNQQLTQKIDDAADFHEAFKCMVNEGSSLATLNDWYRAECARLSITPCKDYGHLSEECKRMLKEEQDKCESISDAIKTATQNVAAFKQKYDDALLTYEGHNAAEKPLVEQETETKKKLQAEIDQIDTQIDTLELKIRKNKQRQAELDEHISRQLVMLEGAVTCPNCKYQFFVNQSQTVGEAQKALDDLKNELAGLKESIKELIDKSDSLDALASDREKELDSIEDNQEKRVRDLQQEYTMLQSMKRELKEVMDVLDFNQKRQLQVQKQIENINAEMDAMLGRFIADVSNSLTDYVEACADNRARNLSKIKSLQDLIQHYEYSKADLSKVNDDEHIESLQQALDKYNEDLSLAQEAVRKIQSDYNVLKEQEANFVAFKSHLARKKIDALSAIVNDFLEKIGSDIRLKLEGYMKTKTGKVRDKISVRVIRDGIDCGSYHKFSGGEKARLNLACILSLHTLTNMDCEDGKGLDFLIIDELLDKSDEVGMATYCEALNKLGKTALLITQGGVSENYPHKLLIVKSQGVSRIQTE